MSREKKTVVITGADRGCGYALTREFLRGGYQVYAGQFMPEWPELEKLFSRYPEDLCILPLDVSSDQSVEAFAKAVEEKTDHLDILVSVAGINPAADDREAFVKTLQTNTLGPLRMAEAFLPLLEQGQKRICVFSSEAGCNTLAHRTEGFAYCLSKTALNMETKLLFNELRPGGYTFRVYHPGWVRSYMHGTKSTVGNFEPEESAGEAYRQFTKDRECEDVLLMSDVSGEVWPW